MDYELRKMTSSDIFPMCSIIKKIGIDEVKGIISSPEMKEMLSKGDKEGVDMAFDLAARLISCNRNGRNITGSQLRKKYNMSFETLLVFYSAYLDFIEEVKNSKN